MANFCQISAEIHRNFPTGSHFSGGMLANLNIMNGFGVYTYPNESAVYRGLFQDGKFHGYGCLQIKHPQKFEINGHFENGVIVSIKQIIFSDGLKCEFENNKINFDNWVYCTDGDRRYSTELMVGLQAVGPSAFLTRARPERDLADHCYDTEEGIYNTVTGFLTHIPKPFQTPRFITNNSEIDWITRHCRKGPSCACAQRPSVEPSPELSKQIMSNNLKSLRKMQLSCDCKLHETADDEISVLMTPSEKSCSSFCENSITEDIEVKPMPELNAVSSLLEPQPNLIIQ